MRKLCFTCKEPQELEHRCLGKGKIHYIEVMSNGEEEHEEIELLPKGENEGDGQQDSKGTNLNCIERIATLVW